MKGEDEKMKPDNIHKVFLWMNEQMRTNGSMLENAFGNVKLHTKTADALAILLQGEARLKEVLQYSFKCPACYAPIDEADKFCRHCGASAEKKITVS